MSTIVELVAIFYSELQSYVGDQKYPYSETNSTEIINTYYDRLKS